MDKETYELMDRVVNAILLKEPEDIRRKGQQKAAHVLQQGVQGSSFARGQHVMMHYEHYQEYSRKVWEAMLQVAKNAEEPVHPGTAAELKVKFDSYMAPLIAKTQAGVSELMRMIGGQPSRPTFDEVHNETRTRYHNEIDIWVRSALEEQRREQRMATKITYNNLSGANARILINSTDYSINIANSQPIFEGIKSTIQEGVEDEQLRTKLIAKTAELETALKAKEKPKFLKIYSEWVALAANHMKLLGPWIPAITEYLTKLMT
jgi:hypothetical protein